MCIALWNFVKTEQFQSSMIFTRGPNWSGMKNISFFTSLLLFFFFFPLIKLDLKLGTLQKSLWSWQTFTSRSYNPKTSIVEIQSKGQTEEKHIRSSMTSQVLFYLKSQLFQVLFLSYWLFEKGSEEKSKSPCKCIHFKTGVYVCRCILSCIQLWWARHVWRAFPMQLMLVSFLSPHWSSFASNSNEYFKKIRCLICGCQWHKKYAYVLLSCQAKHFCSKCSICRVLKWIVYSKIYAIILDWVL